MQVERCNKALARINKKKNCFTRVSVIIFDECAFSIKKKNIETFEQLSIMGVHIDRDGV